MGRRNCPWIGGGGKFYTRVGRATFDTRRPALGLVRQVRRRRRKVYQRHAERQTLPLRSECDEPNSLTSIFASKVPCESANRTHAFDRLTRTNDPCFRMREILERRRLFRAVLTSSVSSGDVSEAIVETLRLAWRLASQWRVGSPQNYEGGEWEWTGYAEESTFSDSAVAALDFQVGNLQGGESDVLPAHAHASS
jgi:hypothetical protein